MEDAIRVEGEIADETILSTETSLLATSHRRVRKSVSQTGSLDVASATVQAMDTGQSSLSPSDAAHFAAEE